MQDPTLVIDFGSGFVKAGFAGSNTPSLVFPTLIGRQRHAKVASGSEPLVGEAAQTSSEVIPKSVIERGSIKNFHDFCVLVNYIYQSMDLRTENNNVLIARPSGTDTKQLETITEYFLETLRVPSISFISSAALSILSTGHVTGIVAECGYGVTNVVPIFESYGLEHARITSELGGYDVDNSLKTLLKKIGMTENDNAAVHEVKEQLCYVRTSKDAPELPPAPYEMPSGMRLNIGPERYLGAECLFDPSLINSDAQGLSNSIATSIGRCDQYLRKDLIGNVVISGGSTMFPGMAERIENDLKASLQANPRIIAAPERKYGAWVGGSIFAATPVFEQFQIKKVDWDSKKEKIFRQKSFM